MHSHMCSHMRSHMHSHSHTHTPLTTLLGVVKTMPPPGCGGTTPLSWVWWGHVRPLHCKTSVVIVDTLPAEYGYIVGSVTPCMSSLDLQVYAYANAYGGIAPQAKCVCDNFIR